MGLSHWPYQASGSRGVSPRQEVRMFNDNLWRLGLALFVACACQFPVRGQTHPDFSGTWRMDVQRTPGANPGRTDTYVVSQDAGMFVVFDRDYPENTKEVYRLDGSVTTRFKMGG